jgi:transcriptional regulator GlxA family with amidase domain
MRKRLILIGLGAAALALLAVPVLLAPRGKVAPHPQPSAISPAEHQATIEALAPPKRQRPVIAIVALNEKTEVSDFLVSNGVLRESGVADVTIVAEQSRPIQLYPALRVKPEATMSEFDARVPEGADYVVVPAMEPRDDPAVLAWINAQHAKGAKIVAICNGAETVAAAGLLDGRRATAHWYNIGGLEAAHPTMKRVTDRRYVVDRGVATSTGITASMPMMTALVEAIAGRGKAEEIAAKLGLESWDERHSSQAFQLNAEHRKTYVRNRLSFWRHTTVGIPVEPNVDEITLGLLVDAYSRTELATVATVSEADQFVRTRRGLEIAADRSTAAAAPDTMLRLTASEAPAQRLDRALAHIAATYDRPTAAFVALTMEYPWPEPYGRD